MPGNLCGGCSTISSSARILFHHPYTRRIHCTKTATCVPKVRLTCRGCCASGFPAPPSWLTAWATWAENTVKTTLTSNISFKKQQRSTWLIKHQPTFNVTFRIILSERSNPPGKEICMDVMAHSRRQTSRRLLVPCRSMFLNRGRWCTCLRRLPIQSTNRVYPAEHSAASRQWSNKIGEAYSSSLDENCTE